MDHSSLPAHVREWIAMTPAQQLAQCDRLLDPLRTNTDYCEACGGDGYVEEGPACESPIEVPCEACGGTGCAAPATLSREGC